MIETTMARPLLALLHVSDSLFPIGGFGYSDGLEAADGGGNSSKRQPTEVVGRMDGAVGRVTSDGSIL
jgi:hypothetical protein